jgi:hypothetical protein
MLPLPGLTTHSEVTPADGAFCGRARRVHTRRTPEAQRPRDLRRGRMTRHPHERHENFNQERSRHAATPKYHPEVAPTSFDGEINDSIVSENFHSHRFVFIPSVVTSCSHCTFVYVQRDLSENKFIHNYNQIDPYQRYCKAKCSSISTRTQDTSKIHSGNCDAARPTPPAREMGHSLRISVRTAPIKFTSFILTVRSPCAPPALP